MDYLLLTFGSLLLAVDFALNKIYQGIYGTAPRAAFVFNMLSGAGTALIFFAVSGFKISCSPFSFCMAAAVSGLVMTYNIIGFRLLRSGTMAMYTLFLMTGGMVLPYIWGLIFLDEPFSAKRMVGLAVITVSVAISNSKSKRPDLKQLGMCCAVFVINGFVSIASKMHQVSASTEKADTAEFIALQGIFKLLLAGILLLALRRFGAPDTETVRDKGIKKAIALTSGSAMLGGTFSLLQLGIAVTLPASVLYPFNTGFTIVMSSLTGVLMFRERLSRRTALSIILCFIGTLMFV